MGHRDRPHRHLHTVRRRRTRSPLRESFLVYRYQYSDMRRPKIDAKRRVYGDRRDYDFLPPVVVGDIVHVAATNKRDAIAAARSFLESSSVLTRARFLP